VPSLTAERKPESVAPRQSTTSSVSGRCPCGGTAGAGGECSACRQRRLASARSTDVHASTLDHGFGRIPVLPRTSTLEPDGDTETVEAATETQVAPVGAPDLSGFAVCGVSASFSSIPSGAVAASLSGSKLGAPFDMVGNFSATRIPCTCACGEYRQYIRGYFKKNGSTVTHRLCGTDLDPTNYQEDCVRIGGTDYKYGYRSLAFATSNFTNPDQATGCRFEGHDNPGITGSSGDDLEVNLDFIGTLVDTCDGNVVRTSSSWSVTGRATVP
jgi:hypothetical protein